VSEAEFHVLVRLIQEKTSLHIAGNMAIRAALEMIQQRATSSRHRQQRNHND